MAEELKFQIVVGGEASTQAAIENLTKSVQSNINSLQAQKAMLADAGFQAAQAEAAKLKNEIEELTKPAHVTGFQALGHGIKDAAGEIPMLSSGMGGLGSALGILANPLALLPAALAAGAVEAMHMASENAELVVHLKHLSASTGLTVNELFGLRSIAKPLGMDIDSVSTAVSKFEMNLGKNGKAIRELGLDAHDPINALAQLADKFVASEDPMERAKMASAALGRSWKELAPLLEDGGAAIRAIEGTNKVSDADVERYEAIHKAEIAISKEWSNIKFEIGAIAAGPLEAFLDGIKSAIEYLKETNHLWELLQTVGVGATDMDAVRQKNEGALAGLLTNKNVMTGWSSDGIEFDTSKFIEEYKKLGKAEAQAVYSGWADTGDKYGEKAQFDLLNKMRPILQAMPEAAKKKAGSGELSEEEQKSLDAANDFKQKMRDEYAVGSAKNDQKEIVAVKIKYDRLAEMYSDYGDVVAAIRAREGQEIAAIRAKQDEAGAVAQSKAFAESQAADKKNAEDRAKDAIANATYQIAIAESEYRQIAAAKGELSPEAAHAFTNVQTKKKAGVATELRSALSSGDPKQAELKASTALLKIDDDTTKHQLDNQKKIVEGAKKERDEKVKAWREYADVAQSLSSKELSSLLNGQFTLKSAYADVKNAAISMIAEKTTKAIEGMLEEAIFGKASTTANVAIQEVAAANVGAAWSAPSMMASIGTAGGAAATGSAGWFAAMTTAQGYGMAAHAKGGTQFSGWARINEEGYEHQKAVVPTQIYQASHTHSTTTNAPITIHIHGGDQKTILRTIRNATTNGAGASH
jgi:hypothetical protein